jgi:hypothetical protein
MFEVVRRLFVLGLVLTACAMNFDAFEPPGRGTDSAGTDAIPTEGAGDAPIDAPSAVDATADASSDATTPDTSGETSTDAPGDTSVDAPRTSDAGDASDGAVPCTEVGAVTFGGHCYFALGSTNGFTAANSVCASVRAHLVTLTSAAESNAVAPISSGVDRWMGLSKNTSDPPTDASYRFITGEARGTYSNWFPGEPNGSGDCVRMKAGGVQWADDGCTNLHDAICERE